MSRLSIGAGWLEMKAATLPHWVTQSLPDTAVCRPPCLRGELPASPAVWSHTQGHHCPTKQRQAIKLPRDKSVQMSQAAWGQTWLWGQAELAGSDHAKSHLGSTLPGTSCAHTPPASGSSRDGGEGRSSSWGSRRSGLGGPCCCQHRDSALLHLPRGKAALPRPEPWRGARLSSPSRVLPWARFQRGALVTVHLRASGLSSRPAGGRAGRPQPDAWGHGGSEPCRGAPPGDAFWHSGSAGLR
nr:uncharacterized protein LOC125184897 [Anser cygnoides]